MKSMIHRYPKYSKNATDEDIQNFSKSERTSEEPEGSFAVELSSLNSKEIPVK